MINSGVAFMITNAMRGALRARGFSDGDIKNMRPGEAHEILLTPDERAVRGFLEAFVALATLSLWRSCGARLSSDVPEASE
jgi:hypothetical protein